MTVPFGMGCAALLSGRMPTSWARAMRRWMLVPWACLTVGIILGGWWSYEVLGWGGYWAWDPVENASFMPWLTATAFIHSSMVMERREHLKGWTITLVMATFLLTLLGTFMTRSGVFNSVHSFTQSPIGPVFLGYLGVMLVVSVLLLAARVDTLSPPTAKLEGPWSRDMAFLGNNLLFAAFTFTVLLGTVYPLLNEVRPNPDLRVSRLQSDECPDLPGILFLMGWVRRCPGGGPPSRRSCRGSQSRPPSRLSSQAAASPLDSAVGFIMTLRSQVSPGLSRSEPLSPDVSERQLGEPFLRAHADPANGSSACRRYVVTSVWS